MRIVDTQSPSVKHRLYDLDLLLLVLSGRRRRRWNDSESSARDSRWVE